MKPRQADTQTVKTTVLLHRDLWKAAKNRAMDEARDLRDVIASALEAYLKTKPKKGDRR